MTTVREQIIARLAVLQPALLEVTDDSAAHAHHAGAKSHLARVGPVEGTHFELRIVSPTFAGVPPVERHRRIYALLDDLIKTHIHALKIDASA
jgi:BolA protein